MSTLYQRYRPTKWDDVLGNEQMVANLRRLVEAEQPPHAFLLTGPSGCGKTTIARIAAYALGCDDDDFEEIDSGDFRGIEMVRELRYKSGFRGLLGTRRVWLIDEAHKLTNDAQNAFLKLLEDPPAYCFYFLATTDPQRLLTTLKGRCILQTVEPLSTAVMVRLLGKISKLEGQPLPLDIRRAIARKHSDPSIDLDRQIVYDSAGNELAPDDVPACYPRFCLQLLAKVLVSPQAEWSTIIAKDDNVRDTTAELVKALLSRSGWKNVRLQLERLTDDDVESARWGCINYCRTIMIKGNSPKLHDTCADIIDAMRLPFYDSGLAGLTLACYQVVENNS